MNETNYAAITTGVRGLGNVTGEASPSIDTGSTWTTDNENDQKAQTQAVQNFQSQWHDALHNEIDDNDLNPKDTGKKQKLSL